MNRHQGLEWAKVQARLKANAEKLWSLSEMERTGGEPDIVGQDKNTGEYAFYDCSPESPKGRTSLCYDREALDSRKEHKPKSSAMDMAAAMGAELLTEEQYQELQRLGVTGRIKTSHRGRIKTGHSEVGLFISFLLFMQAVSQRDKTSRERAASL